MSRQRPSFTLLCDLSTEITSLHNELDLARSVLLDLKVHSGASKGVVDRILARYFNAVAEEEVEETCRRAEQLAMTFRSSHSES